ncbi:MAG: acyl transferase domain-containing protein/3-hydroxymyristoyl [Candidatus Poriferisodalaceae bacterium]
MTLFPPIAIVGRACVLPGVSSPEQLWEAVVSGTDLISSVPPDRWGMRPADVMCDAPESGADSTDRTWSDRGGYVTGFDEIFDPTGFAVPADEILALDPVFQWTLHTAREALRDAGHAGLDSSRCGAVFGNLSFPSAQMAAYTQAKLMPDAGLAVPDAANRFTSGLPALLLERALGLGGGAFALDAACASSLYAIKLACDQLHDGTVDLMLAGAVNCADDLCIHLGFAALQALSRTGQSRPFHSEADGLVPAEGCGFVALRRLDDAVRDGDAIRGIIRGVGLSNDGRGRGMLVPSSDGQQRAIAQAFEVSGLDPTAISLLECHATGTQVGDATEIRSSAAVYGGTSDLPIGSLKSNTGHLITAAGVAGLIKVIEAMRHATRPPTRSADHPLDAIADSPFRLLDGAEPWDRTTTSDGVLRAGVSAFGFGGNNAHLLVEEPASAAKLLAELVSSDVTSHDRRFNEAVAVVGIGVNAASAHGVDEFADALLTRTSCLDASGRGTMPDIGLDVVAQKFPPNDLKAALAQQLVMLNVTDQALSGVDHDPATTSIYVGMGTDPEAARFGARWRLATLARDWHQTDEWLAAARDEIGPPLTAAGVLGTMPNIVANRLNSQHDLAGPSFTISSEERSGIDALAVACRSLLNREVDTALVGAVDLSCDPVHQAAAADRLTPAKQTPGDAAVVLVLKRLTDAVAAGDTVYATVPNGRRDETGQRCADRPDALLSLDPDDSSVVTQIFGHSHAASGLLHVAAASILLHHRVTEHGLPLIASNSDLGTGLPDGVGPRTMAVSIAAMDGLGARGSVLLAEAVATLSPGCTEPPTLHIFSGDDDIEILDRLAKGLESECGKPVTASSSSGSARLVIVAASAEQFDERSERAVRHISAGFPPGEGVHYRRSPVRGEIAFVYTAAGAAYPGMGRQLLSAIPELTDPISADFPLGEVAGWSVNGDLEHRPSPNDYLWGTSLLSQAHTRLSLDVLKLKPEAAIGYSSGESNSLYAFGVWSDMDAMRREIDASGMMDHELGIEFAAVARAWGESEAEWAMWNILASVDSVRSAVADEARVHLAIINTDNDVVIGGEAAACERVVDLIGRRKCRPVDYNLACHVPEVAESFHQQWVAVHTRAVTPVTGIRHYSNGTNGAYGVSEQACAEAITRQAETTIDFPATIRAAYADGVRIFVEHGPAGACTNFIKEILADDDAGNNGDVLAVHLDRRDRNIEHLYEVVAALVAAGVDVDVDALSTRLRPVAVSASETSTAKPDGPVLTFPTHPRAARLKDRETAVNKTANNGSTHVQLMSPAPELPSVSSTGHPPRPYASHVASHSLPTAVDVAPSELDEVAAVILQQLAGAASMHEEFLTQQGALHQQFLALRNDLAAALPQESNQRPKQELAATEQSSVIPRTRDDLMGEPASTKTVLAHPNRVGFYPTGPVWDKEQLRIHSSGRISELFGPTFEAQDRFDLQCRMPEPPLLLADRVTGLLAEPGVLGKGTIWTETDVEAGAWYLNNGHMPAGFMIESGQADLMLISYMGIDLLNQGERAYRLLGCTLTYHGDLPAPGETLEYEIRITGHARHGDVRLFFFEYDCIVDGQPRLTVRDAQAGFFNAAELEEALGVLWTPEEGRSDLDAAARVDPPAIACTKTTFSSGDVAAFSEGRLYDCFGEGYEWAQTHTRSPSIQAGDQLFIHEITDFDPTGGPWGRGFMRCETMVNADDWFFDGHFKNDPCMPGNFMVEACIQAMSFYIAALGHTARHDGWRFQPLPEQPFELKCRGEINPATNRVVYELHVEEVWNGPTPTVICDVIGFVDGKAAFHAHRIGVALVPSWPLTSMPGLYEGVIEPVEVATDRNGFKFDWKAMIACAWGRPSDAFGEMYEMFDGVRQSPRLPGEPYHFISRVTKIDGELDVCEAGMEIVCEYDIPDDAWYFNENGTETMPFAVLLEAALQPCGWVASAVGSVTDLDEDLMFRNLDGTGTLVDELTRTAGVLTTRVKLKSVSRAGGMIIEGFEVVCELGDRVVYTMDTVFGFFPPEAFENQVGLAVSDDQRAQLEAHSASVIDLTERPDPYFGGEASGAGPALANPMLLMLDRVSHFAGGGEAGLGVVRGEKDVDVNEWFFKAHFFQDPVQPGSLGIEALIQLLQCYMLEHDMGGGPGSHFEPLMLDAPMTWKYRGQVTPSSRMITTVMEITEVGEDQRGPYVIGVGSLWCDGIRIYESSNMGMRIVSDQASSAVGAAATASKQVVEVPKADALEAMRDFWNPLLGVPEGWLGEDLVLGFADRYVNRILVQGAETLNRLQGRPAIFLGNHQVQIESLIVTNLLPALTGLPMTTVANAKHEQRWIGDLIRVLEAHPGSAPLKQIAYFDQAEPESMFTIVREVAAGMAAGQQSFFVHPQGTRAQSSRELTTKCSSVFVDLAIELGVPIVPVRFLGGLPDEPIDGKLEFPVGHGAQDYWIGEPIEAEQLKVMGLRERIDYVISSINNLGGHPSEEQTSPADSAFADLVEARVTATGNHEVWAAANEILRERSVNELTGGQAEIVLDAERAGTYRSDSTPIGDWLGSAAERLFGPGGATVDIGAFAEARLTSVVVSAETHPHLADHTFNGVPVVPAVYAMEWFARAAQVHSPELDLISLDNIKVLKGLTAPELFDGRDLRLAVSSMVTESSGSETLKLSLDLTDEAGRLHYRCAATLGHQGLAASAQRLPSEPNNLAPYEGGVLFHGPRFQMIEAVSRPTSDGIAATILGTDEMDWPLDDLRLDVAALDGGLQLALLWTGHVLGGPSLPTSIGSFVPHTKSASGLYRADLHAITATKNKVVTDIAFYDASSPDVTSPMFELRRVETHLLPGGATS